MQDLPPFILTILIQHNFNVFILKGLCLLLTSDVVNYQAFSIPNNDNTKSIFTIVSYPDLNNHQESYSIKIKRKKNNYTSKLSLNHKTHKRRLQFVSFVQGKSRERKQRNHHDFFQLQERGWDFFYFYSKTSSF